MTFEMKMACTLFFAMVAASGCSREDTHNNNMEVANSARLISRHRALENAIHAYYLSIEEDVKKDLGVSDAEVIRRVQSLIDEGYVRKPAILILRRDGAKWETVDYSTYKEFMADHAIISRKFYGIQPSLLDSLFTDSTRHALFDTLRANSLD